MTREHPQLRSRREQWRTGDTVAAAAQPMHPRLHSSSFPNSGALCTRDRVLSLDDMFSPHLSQTLQRLPENTFKEVI